MMTGKMRQIECRTTGRRSVLWLGGCSLAVLVSATSPAAAQSASGAQQPGTAPAPDGRQSPAGPQATESAKSLDTSAAPAIDAAPRPQTPLTAITKSDTAQADAGRDRPADPQSSDVVVTGSRITASGFSAPTPTTVLSIEQLQQTAKPNLYDSLAELPALQGSVGTSNNRQNGGTSLGNNGLSALNLRGLGTIRTLTLLDGQRVVPAYITGIADVSEFPQLLIKRVDVVTGGASASWGSDAISGVVNFVTDTKFEGFKANVLGGITTYGDGKSALIQMAAGKAFLGDRLHLEAAGEYYSNEGVAAGEVGGAQPNGRPDAYRSGTTSYALGAQPAGSPQYYAYPYNAQTTTLGRYGLITAGPLAGTAFDASGNPYAFQYGTGCVSSVCQGGQQDNYITTITIDNPINRVVAYTRAGFDLGPRWEIYGNFNYAKVDTRNQPIAYPRKTGNLTISCANAFLPASITAACATNRITSFQFGTANASLPAKELVKSDRRQIRFVVGTDGTFDVFHLPIKFDVYYQHGENKVDVNLSNITLNARYNAAINAVRNTSGQIACASAVAVAEGCSPINIFGNFPLTAAQFSFIAPTPGPYQRSTFKEDVASAAFNVTPFRLWAGDVSMAFGAEWRREAYVTTADPYGNGIAADSPYTASYPADPLLSSGGNNWFAGNFHNGSGRYDVHEEFLELGIPLLNSARLGKVNVNLAGRNADYSTAGNAKTWKAGGTWETPLEGFRIRSVFSRDLRAPNLSELFAAPQTQNNPVINRATGISTQVVTETLGNPTLKPEIAYTFEIGGAYRPPFIRGLNLSIDYYNIRVRQAIAALTFQQVVDLCYNGNTAYCPNVKFTGVLGTSDFPYVITQSFNLASLTARGLDIEVSYVRDLGIGWLTLRALGTRAFDLISNTGIAGQQIAQLAGNNTDTGNGVPRWKVLLSQSLTRGPATLNFTERYISSGAIDPNAITCSTGSCPVSTVQNPTYNFNHIPAAAYLDIGGNVRILSKTDLYFKIDNAFDHRAPPFGGSVLYDVVGRVFRVGVRLAL